MTRTIGCVVGLAILLGGCFNTNSIKNAGLECNSVAGACPDGFACKAGLCWKNGTGPDAGGTGSDASNPGTDATVPIACTPSTPPYGPFATCSPSPANPNTCDPVCQLGCDCGKRCVFDSHTGNSFTCEATSESPNFAFVQPTGKCDTNDTACAPGSVCIPDDVCGSLCYRTCRTLVDCGGKGRCTQNLVQDQNLQPLVPNVFLCSGPAESCNPTGTASCVNARAGFNCVFFAGLTGTQVGDATTCDCATFHDKSVGATCTSVPDNCQPGAACINNLCHRICNLQGSVSLCAGTTGGGKCTAIYGSSQYGYCP